MEHLKASAKGGKTTYLKYGNQNMSDIASKKWKKYTKEQRSKIMQAVSRGESPDVDKL